MRTAALLCVLAASPALACSGSTKSERGATPQSHSRSHPDPFEPNLVLADCFEDLPSPSVPPLPFVQGSSTLAVLPDTQVYAEYHPAIFDSQTRWIADHRHERNIRFALHLGDITNTSREQEWVNAVAAMGLLDGLVPYAMAPGNHDYDEEQNTRDSLLSKYFPVRKFQDQPTFGGTHNANVLDNSYHLFSAGGRDWIAVMLEWGPRETVVDWAAKVLDAYADRTAIIVTHAYMFHDGNRQDHTRADQLWNPHDYATAELPGGVYDGQQLWDTLVSKHGNVSMVLSGHVLGDGAALLSSEGEHGNTVHQMLSNYQMMENGGQGYLRLIELLPDGKTVQIKTYSPVLDDYLTGDEQQFKIEIDVRLSEPIRT